MSRDNGEGWRFYAVDAGREDADRFPLSLSLLPSFSLASTTLVGLSVARKHNSNFHYGFLA